MEAVQHRARWVMVEPGRCIENGLVEFVDSRIAAVGRARPGTAARDHGSGVIMPALVNAHTHLSLSALAGLATRANGFVDWVRQLIRSRETIAPATITSEALKAAEAAKRTGTGLLAEIGPWEPGASALEQAGLQGTVFLELLGNVSDSPEVPVARDGLSFSLAGHGLHTTHHDTMQLLKRSAAALRRPFSMHLAESSAETDFLIGRSGEWAELLQERGIDLSAWDLLPERPVARAQRLGLLGRGTLAVHCLDVHREEIEVLAETGTSVCVCPRSNLSLHDRLPDIGALVKAGIPVALGTDSLASVPSLSMFEEMAFVSRAYPNLKPTTILGMAGINGARALDRFDLGRIGSGKAAVLMYVDVAAQSHDDVAPAIVSSAPDAVEWI